MMPQFALHIHLVSQRQFVPAHAANSPVLFWRLKYRDFHVLWINASFTSHGRKQKQNYFVFLTNTNASSCVSRLITKFISSFSGR